jgi:hypothetical protein
MVAYMLLRDSVTEPQPGNLLLPLGMRGAANYTAAGAAAAAAAAAHGIIKGELTAERFAPQLHNIPTA